jgi:leader peptidase (prepilin peptidase) / N-methyltransferase
MPYMIVGLFGLAFGSFLNVCIARLPSGESIVTPRSHCPRCGRAIRWYDNVPLVSYVVLLGRCRDCKTRISPVYPLVELLTAATLLADYYRFGLGPELLKWGIFSFLLIILIFTDLNLRRIPHAITLLGAVLGLALSFLIPVDCRPVSLLLAHWNIFPAPTALSSMGAMSGALIGSGLFYGIGEAFFHIYGKEGIGFGDVMLMLMVGMFFGPALTLMTILLGSLFGCLVAIPLHLFAPRFRKYQWPYGSFLGAAAIFASLWGPALLAIYLRWAGLN